MLELLKKPYTTLVLCVALAAVVGYAFGRFNAPTKVITKDRFVETVRTDLVIDAISRHLSELERKRDVERTITTIKRRDGTVFTREQDREHTDTKKTDQAEVAKHEAIEQVVTVEKTVEKIVERSHAGFRAGVHVDHWPGHEFDLGLSAGRRILGPVWLEVEGFKSGRYGVSLNLEF